MKANLLLGWFIYKSAAFQTQSPFFAPWLVQTLHENITTIMELTQVG